MYDAIRVLEAKGLVEVQHSNPQQFRAVPIDEAVSSLQQQYESRVETLRQALEEVEPAETGNTRVSQEVWAISGSEAIANRTQQLISEATKEVVMVVGADELLTEELLTELDVASSDVNVLLGALSQSSQEAISEQVPAASVFVSGLDWLHTEAEADDVSIGRLLLIGRETILVSAIEHNGKEEHGVFGTGFGNGLVVIARRLMATGLIPAEDPSHS